ncbi:TolC family protein [Sphingomonas lenta]|uniref:Transporter n=1 Tax=Sphingomonas lenta TaxID=1141887 RepID=A0A2A2SB71_9SPHN|nr:TolC family protein [Sphingomonas lenta]PAX06497.1 transporter [Sphingomonas lenta]
MHRVIAALLAVASPMTIAQAQSPGPTQGPPLTLERALDLAGATAPSVEAASAGVRAAEAGRTVAGLRPNPTINAETENVVGTGQYEGLRSAETTVGVALPIELGGKRSARIAVADAIGIRAQVDQAVAAADVRLAVTQAYVEAAAAERRVVTAREQAAIASEALRAANVRVRAGRASPIEEQRADVLRLNAAAALERAERLAETARGNLARRIGQPVAGPLDLAWFERVEGVADPRPTAPALTLAAARADAATAAAQVRLARSQRIPDLTVSASARRLEQTDDVAAVFGVSIPIPLFNRGTAAVAQARAERDRADALVRAAELDADQAVANARAEVANAAVTARTAAGPTLAAARESARIARIGYREGKFGQLDLLDAERTLSETRAAAIDALAAYHDARARLERLTASAPGSTGR